MTVQFVLIDQSGPRPQAVFERSIGRRVEIGEAAPDALVRGYGKALAEILTELSGELRGVGAQQAR
jgi:hypothetical protein